MIGFDDIIGHNESKGIGKEYDYFVKLSIYTIKSIFDRPGRK